MDRKQRITNPQDFKRVRRDGRSYAHPLVVLITCPNQLGYERFGITTSRSLARAVDRNRAKRRLRHAVRSLVSDRPRGQDNILIARPPLLSASWEELQRALAQLLEEAKSA